MSAVFCIRETNMGQVNYVTDTKVFERIFMGFWRVFWKTLRFEGFRNLIFDFSLSAMVDWTFVYAPTQLALFYDIPFKNASSAPKSPKNSIFSNFQWFSQFFAPSSKANRLTKCIFGINVQDCIEWHIFGLHIMTFIFPLCARPDPQSGMIV